MDYIYGAYFLFRIVATPSKPTTPLPDTSSPIIKSGKGTSKATGVPTLLENIVSPIKNVVSQVTSERPATQEDSCKVTIQVHWPSKVRKKVLDSDLSSLGKMLCRGTYRQIARAAWSCKKLQQYFLEQVARQIHHECSEICRGELKKKGKVRKASILRKTDNESIKNFSFEQLNEELTERAPLFQLVLKTASLRAEDKSRRSLQCVGVAAAVCLKNRSRNMTALQLILAIINQVSGFSVSFFFYLNYKTYSRNCIITCNHISPKEEGYFYPWTETVSQITAHITTSRHVHIIMQCKIYTDYCFYWCYTNIEWN